MLKFAFFSLLACASWGTLAGDIYAYLAPDGSYHFADERRDARYTLYLRDAAPAAGLNAPQPRGSPAAYRPFIENAAAREGIDPALLHALIWVESGYDPAALSPKGALGLMQLMPATAGRFGVNDRADPEQNIAGGTRYLRTLLDRFGRIDLALAAYNAGEEAVERHKRRIPPFAETLAYVPRVLERYRKLQKETP
ncbi:MAG: lytic transglycosylase domain-containing protein [Betaproteobacteria bacterium]